MCFNVAFPNIFTTQLYSYTGEAQKQKNKEGDWWMKSVLLKSGKEMEDKEYLPRLEKRNPSVTSFLKEQAWPRLTIQERKNLQIGQRCTKTKNQLWISNKLWPTKVQKDASSKKEKAGMSKDGLLTSRDVCLMLDDVKVQVNGSFGQLFWSGLVLFLSSLVLSNFLGPKKDSSLKKKL